jgi:hypothetical protein
MHHGKAGNSVSNVAVAVASSRMGGHSWSSSSYSARASQAAWGCWSAVQTYLLGPHFQLGLQLAVGIVLTSLPVFMR